MWFTFGSVAQLSLKNSRQDVFVNSSVAARPKNKMHLISVWWMDSQRDNYFVRYFGWAMVFECRYTNACDWHLLPKLCIRVMDHQSVSKQINCSLYTNVSKWLNKYVCMYVCMYVCKLCMYVCNRCMYVCMYVCTCVYMYVCMYVCMHLFVCIYVCVCVCVCVCVNLCVIVCACGYVYVYCWEKEVYMYNLPK